MEIVYVIAISLQICGAIILLLSSFGHTENEMDKAIMDSSGRAVLSGLFIDDIDISERLKEIYLNRSAFACLGFGYVLGIFGNIGKTSKVIIALLVIAFSIFTTAILYFICSKLAKARQKVYKEKFKDKTNKRMM